MKYLIDFNWNWKFILNEDQKVFAEKLFDDNNWKLVNIPHDWSVESSFDDTLEGATAYLPGGIAWYRKSFLTPELYAKGTTYIQFDGVYNNSTIYINGVKIGEHPYGYSPFYFDITSYLTKDKSNNILAVRVDHSRYCDSRWYTGSGIYRKVELIHLPQIHIPIWGNFITTPFVSELRSVINLEITIKNTKQQKEEVDVLSRILNSEDQIVGEIHNRVSIPEMEEMQFSQQIELKKAELWDITSPYLYRAVTSISDKERSLHLYENTFGIRSFEFDPDNGFFLNGKHTLIKGVCLHHDGGLCGAAVPRGVWKRRLKTLKECGVNAIRIAHNPGSAEFLDLCDEMGFLVQDEFFDEWDFPKDKRLNLYEKSIDYITRSYSEHFLQWAESDLKNTVLSHRNHPSIIQWSIGNEIEWTYPGNIEASGFNNPVLGENCFWKEPPNSIDKIKEQLKKLPENKYVIGKTAAKLRSWTREVDVTRPITANCIIPSVSYQSGYGEALDIIGYSYRRAIYDYGHQNYREKPIIGAETVPQWHEWKAVIDHRFVAGLFLWTGIDYMGEVNGRWPFRSVISGLLDTAGFKKTSFYMMKSLWTNAPHIHLTTQLLDNSPYILQKNTLTPIEKDSRAWEQKLWFWHKTNTHWNYPEGKLVIVEAYSNCEKIELFLDEVSYGILYLKDFPDMIYKWAVPFLPGRLHAHGSKKLKNSKTEIVTSSVLNSILLKTDKAGIKSDNEDVFHITATLIDSCGIQIEICDVPIHFVVNGPCRILGVDNGSSENIQNFQSDNITTYRGKALLVIQSTGVTGEITIKAHSENLKSNSISVFST